MKGTATDPIGIVGEYFARRGRDGHYAIRESQHEAGGKTGKDRVVHWSCPHCGWSGGIDDSPPTRCRVTMDWEEK